VLQHVHERDRTKPRPTRLQPALEEGPRGGDRDVEAVGAARGGDLRGRLGSPRHPARAGEAAHELARAAADTEDGAWGALRGAHFEGVDDVRMERRRLPRALQLCVRAGPQEPGQVRAPAAAPEQVAIAALVERLEVRRGRDRIEPAVPPLRIDDDAMGLLGQDPHRRRRGHEA
jgi:hypothetical protein